MKKKSLLLVAVTACSLLIGSVVFADHPTQTVQPSSDISSVIAAIDSSKLANVSSIDFDDGQWEVKTSAKGQETKYVLQNDSKLTKIKVESDNDPEAPADISVLKKAIDTAKKTATPGSTVKSVEFQGMSWEVTTIDKNAVEHEIVVGGAGSKVISSKIDD